jgi:hypothetical protein
MPPDRTRVVNAQGRQKSCSLCAKGKRKCDLDSPSCGRCRKQHLACVYPEPLEQPNTVATDPPSFDLEGFGIQNISVSLGDIETTTLPLDFSSSTSRPTDFDLDVGITSLEAFNNVLYSSSNEEEQSALERSRHGLEKAFSVAQIAPAAKSRTRWSIEQLKLVPKTMIEENGTPWQHAMLYQEYMPQSLQDSYAACALYLAKNSTNEDFVNRFIKERSTTLIASVMPIQPTEILARAHALVLYQSMLVFGGDMSLYSQAEQLLPHMDGVCQALLGLSSQQAESTDLVPLYPSASARASWAAYIFRESLRRTVLAVSQITTLCSLLRGQLTPCSHDVAIGNRLTISAHLWNAKTAFDFALAWNSRKHFTVIELDFTEVLRDAMPDDIDIFGKMMMISLKGEDDIKGWFYTRGGIL